MKHLLRFVQLTLFIISFLVVGQVQIFSADPTDRGVSSISSNSSGIYLDVVNNLIAHINGDTVLTDADFEANHDLLVQNIDVLATDVTCIERSFELIALFETTVGAIFTTNNTKNGFNRGYRSDGLNLHRNIMAIQQGLLDHTYNQTWVNDTSQLLNGKAFQTSSYFPGSVDAPLDPEGIETATIRCSYMLARGSQPHATIGNSNVIRPTGCYLAPGSIAEINVPQSMVGKGIKIRVGAHFWDLSGKGNYKRMDRVTITYDIDNVVTKVAHPLGGGIYIELPLGIDEGILDISLKNVVRAPFFSKKEFHETTLEEWQETERNHPAPWADFETDKFMMQVPTSWIYAFDDPKSLLEDWDKSMDAVSDLLGRPRIADRHKNYLQFDVIIRGSAYHPGYPMSNTPYNPNGSTNGTPNHNILKGPQFQQDIHFHELGHEVAITKFAGETEAFVNFLYVPVLNRCFGYSLADAFQMSFGPSYNYQQSKDNTVKTRLVSNTFCEGQERNICNCTKNEVRYQHRGYAHYVDIVELYGWEALERFFKDESDAADMGNPFPVNNQPKDDRIFRMSKAVGVDLRPLFHFWGIHPDDQDELAQRMQDNELRLPMNIKEKLRKYLDFTPNNYQEFVAFGQELYPNFLNYSGTQFDYGEGWFQQAALTYDEAKAAKIKQALSDIIVYYYGTDCFNESEFLPTDFSFPTEVCKSDALMPLPLMSDNGVPGSWIPNGIDASAPGQFNLVFYPNLDGCALEDTLTINVVENQAALLGDDFICSGDTTTIIADTPFESYEWYLDGQLIGNDNAIEVSEPGVLSLIAVDADFCIYEGATTIEKSDPIQLTIEVEDPLCYGEYGIAEFIPDSMAMNYSFSMTGDSLLAGNYDVTVTDPFGCSEVFNFSINQPDEISIDLIDDVLVFSGGVPPYSFVADTVGNIIQVMVKDDNGCEASASFTLMSGTTGPLFKVINIYPNPAQSSLHIDFGNLDFHNLKFSLFDLTGSEIKKHQFDNGLEVKSIQLDGITKGIYFYKIQKERGEVVKSGKLIIE
jgi:hypothetical protein